MRTRTVVYKDDSYDVEIDVRQAALGGGFRRTALRSRELAQSKKRDAPEGPEGYLAQWVAFRTLPDCLGATAEIRNLDKEKEQLSSEMNLEEFLALPEALVIVWEQAVYECNPHWMPLPKEEEESGEAPEPDDNSTLTKDSSSGSKTKNPKTNQNGTSTT